MMEKNEEGYKKADVGKRILAAIIDGLIASAPIFIMFGVMLSRVIGSIPRERIIDGFIASAPILIEILGTIASVAYILTKDALPYIISKKEDWKNRSVGKKLMGLKIVELSGQDIDITISCKRNIILAIGSLSVIVFSIPVLGWIGGIIGCQIQLALWGIEVGLVSTDPKGRRVGDTIANTQVVDA